MSPKLSVEELLSTLEQRAASLREEEALHARQETHHREQRALVVAELEKVTQNLEALQTVVAATADLVKTAKPAAVPALPPPGRLMVGKLLRLVVEEGGLKEPFSPAAVAAEANRRFADRLREPVSSRTASDSLRRMLAEGRIRLAREGRGPHGALYTRTK
jgi:hypothetical protein